MVVTSVHGPLIDFIACISHRRPLMPKACFGKIVSKRNGGVGAIAMACSSCPYFASALGAMERSNSAFN